MPDAGRAHGACEGYDTFAFRAATGAGQADSQMLGSSLRNAAKDAGQAFGGFLRGETLLYELRNPIVDSDARAQTLAPTGTRFFQIGEGIERLLHGAIVSAGGRFLTEAHERRT